MEESREARKARIMANRTERLAKIISTVSSASKEGIILD